MNMEVVGFLDLLTGYQPAMAIIAARRLRLFDALSATPQGLDEIATVLGADDGALGALLRALVGIGLVTQDDAGYSATTFVTSHLADDRDLALVVDKEDYFARAWLSLDEVARSGRPALDPWRHRIEGDPETASMFLEALNVLAEHTGPPLWELPELRSAKRILDVGGGFGFYANRLASSGATVVLVDLPEVIEMLARRLSPIPAGSVELVAADVMAAPSCGVPPGSVDAALVSHMLHDLSEAEGIRLLQRVILAVKPGGSVVVNDFAGEVGPGAFGPMFDVMMRVETGGAAYPLATLRSTLESAGLQKVQVAGFPEPATVLIGRVA
ncbi:MAG TPA: methyltransferase [Acidimicrobiia bacterium]|nr:methyltransferase [Acidimicrobiia bacterium]